MSEMTAMERRKARAERGAGTGLDMNLTALIDVFTILIFFLLSTAVGVETLVSPRAVKLPMANAEQQPKQTVVLVIAGDEILVDGRTVASVAQVMGSSEDLIPGVQAELELLGSRQAVRAENQAQQQAVTILADKEVPYALLRKVMVSCAKANFADVSFAVRSRFES